MAGEETASPCESQDGQWSQTNTPSESAGKGQLWPPSDLKRQVNVYDHCRLFSSPTHPCLNKIHCFGGTFSGPVGRNGMLLYVLHSVRTVSGLYVPGRWVKEHRLRGEDSRLGPPGLRADKAPQTVDCETSSWKEGGLDTHVLYSSGTQAWWEEPRAPEGCTGTKGRSSGARPSRSRCSAGFRGKKGVMDLLKWKELNSCSSKEGLRPQRLMRILAERC